MQSESVSFYSEGVRLEGDLYRPAGAGPEDVRAGIVLCHGYTGVKSLYLPDNARVLTEAGYVVLTFDYKGWGASEGPRTRLAPFSRIADVQAALTFLGTRPGVDPAHLGLYGTSYGGATAIWAAALDERVRCVVSVVGIGDGRRWMRSVRRPDEWHDLLEKAREDREQAVMSGESAMVERDEDPAAGPGLGRALGCRAGRQSRRGLYRAGLLHRRDALLPRRLGGGEDRAASAAPHHHRGRPPGPARGVPISLQTMPASPKKLIVLKGYGHYDVYAEPAFGEVMAATLAWYRAHLPAQA